MGNLYNFIVFILRVSNMLYLVYRNTHYFLLERQTFKDLNHLGENSINTNKSLFGDILRLISIFSVKNFKYPALLFSLLSL